MRFPGWLREWAAFIATWGKPVYSGMLCDYANERYILLSEWRTTEGMAGADEMLDNTMRQERDDIFISMAASSGHRGVLGVHTSRGYLKFIAFHPKFYTFEEALENVDKRCRKLADEMGYRRPDAT